MLALALALALAMAMAERVEISPAFRNRELYDFVIGRVRPELFQERLFVQSRLIEELLDSSEVLVWNTCDHGGLLGLRCRLLIDLTFAHLV